MPVDPKKLNAFANQQPKGGGPPKGQQPGKNGAPPAAKPEGEEEPQEGGDEKYAALIPLLEANVEDLEANCDELDMEMLKDPESEISEEDKQIITESFDMLPKDIKEEMVAVLDGIDMDAARPLAQHLMDEDMIEDAERTTGYLVRLGALIASGDLKAGDGEDEDEDAGDDEEEPDVEAEAPEGEEAGKY